MIKCVIFDCDGTLVDSEYLCNLGLALKLEEYGVKADANDLMQRFSGRKLSDTLVALQNEHQIVLKSDFVDRYRELINQLFEERLQPCDGAEALLQSIQLPMCVASNATLPKMQKALSITGLLPYFSGQLYSAYDIGAWKPDPKIFLHVAQDMGIAANECLVIEDSPVGVEAAVLANMKVVQYCPHEISNDKPPISANHAANYRVEHLADINSLLAEMLPK